MPFGKNATPEDFGGRRRETSLFPLVLFLFLSNFFFHFHFLHRTFLWFLPVNIPFQSRFYPPPPSPPGNDRLPHASLPFPPLLPHHARPHLVHFRHLLRITFLPPTGGSPLPTTLLGPPLSALDIPLHISRPPNDFLRLASCGCNRSLFLMFLLFCSSRRHDFPIGSGERQRCWLGSQPGGFHASAPVVPDSLGFLVEMWPAPGGRIDQRLDFDDVWVIGVGGEVALWCGSVPLANQFSGGRELGGRKKVNIESFEAYLHLHRQVGASYISSGTASWCSLFHELSSPPPLALCGPGVLFSHVCHLFSLR